MALSPTTRDSLLLRIRDVRNRNAWMEFVEIYEPVVYRLLRHAGLQDADAADLTQEILLKINHQVEHFRPGSVHGSFRGWLRRVTRNLLVSWLRERERQPWRRVWEQDQPLDDLLVAPSRETDSVTREEERATFRLAAQRVRNEVHESTWRAFVGVALEGRSIESTAAALQLSPGAVRVAKCRVMARLRSIVEEIRRDSE